jgi:hypothetical protein
MELLSNNEVVNNKINFEYRSSGNYNDLIMEMVNTLISTINRGENKETEAEHSSKTLYAEFETHMTRIFEKVEDEDWMNRGLFHHGKEKMHTLN